VTAAKDIVNAALVLINSQSQITALNDGSTEANAANAVYATVVQLLLRQMDPDFARTTAALALAPSPAIVAPWAYEYTYPATCLRARQVAPPRSGAGSLADPFDPVPIRSSVQFDPNGGGANIPAKVILSNQQNALLVFTSAAVTENQWDAAFTEAAIRRLASPLAMAIAGHPDFARELLEEAERYAGMAELADESADGMV
jgi:hypothetical protein